jgi:hypothetical protein
VGDSDRGGSITAAVGDDNDLVSDAGLGRQRVERLGDQ